MLHVVASPRRQKLSEYNLFFIDATARNKSLVVHQQLLLRQKNSFKKLKDRLKKVVLGSKVHPIIIHSLCEMVKCLKALQCGGGMGDHY
jgi:hypothetical protein